jgi:hypothetical protein
MAIKINGTNVITDAQELANITNLKTVNGQAILGTGNISTSGNYAMRVYTSDDTWTKPTGLRAIKVTVVAGGGASGNTVTAEVTWPGGGGGGSSIEYIDVNNIPTATVPITVGTGGNFTNPAALNGTPSSFGTYASATGGEAGRNAGAGGTGAGGTYNIPGEPGRTSTISSFSFGVEYFTPFSPANPGGPAIANVPALMGTRGEGGSSLFGFGGTGASTLTRGNVTGPGSVSSASLTLSGTQATGYGAGAGGQVRSNSGTTNGANGTSGIVIVEEFY